jgi:hypothetical protein
MRGGEGEGSGASLNQLVLVMGGGEVAEVGAVDLVVMEGFDGLEVSSSESESGAS